MKTRPNCKPWLPNILLGLVAPRGTAREQTKTKMEVAEAMKPKSSKRIPEMDVV
jgi:hypothetical protein